MRAARGHALVVTFAIFARCTRAWTIPNFSRRTFGARPGVSMCDFSAQHHGAPSAQATLDQLVADGHKHLPKDAMPDVYGNGEVLQLLEKEVSAALGKPAAAFLTTGTAANQACVRAALEGRESSIVAVHPTSHMVHLDCLLDGANQFSAETLEQKTRENLLGLEPVFLGDMERIVTVKDVEALVSKSPRPAVLVLEVPQRMNGGASPSWDDLMQIRELCTTHDIHLHLDGARLWEVTPRYWTEAGKHLADVAAVFDSVYVSFYKGVGASTGAMLLGDDVFVKKARRWAKTFGAVPFCNTGNAISCLARWHECTPPGADSPLAAFTARYLHLHNTVDALTALAVQRGWGMRFDPPQPQSAMIHVYLKGQERDLVAAHDQVAQSTGRRLWNRLRGRGHSQAAGAGDEYYFEWSIGPANAEIPVDLICRAWTLFFRELQDTREKAKHA